MPSTQRQLLLFSETSCVASQSTATTAPRLIADCSRTRGRSSLISIGGRCRFRTCDPRLVRTKLVRNGIRSRTNTEHHRVQLTPLCVGESAIGSGGVRAGRDTEYHSERRGFGTYLAPGVAPELGTSAPPLAPRGNQRLLSMPRENLVPKFLKFAGRGGTGGCSGAIKLTKKFLLCAGPISLGDLTPYGSFSNRFGYFSNGLASFEKGFRYPAPAWQRRHRDLLRSLEFSLLMRQKRLASLQ